MNPWIAKTLVLAATLVMITIRAPHGHSSRRVQVVKSHKTRLEAVLLILAWAGFFVPLIWIASPAFSFAEYSLRSGPLFSGAVCFIIGLWLFYRSHADLGTNWSITLEIREEHRLITQGVHRRSAIRWHRRWCLRRGPRAVILNWGRSVELAAFAVLFALRVRAEERMMLEQFGDQHRASHDETFVPGVWWTEHAGLIRSVQCRSVADAELPRAELVAAWRNPRISYVIEPPRCAVKRARLPLIP
jgi:protein-S-isoprenylcysteine O-methyltransferase Ste14